jgi:hypothetical protein
MIFLLLINADGGQLPNEAVQHVLHSEEHILHCMTGLHAPTMDFYFSFHFRFPPLPRCDVTNTLFPCLVVKVLSTIPDLPALFLVYVHHFLSLAGMDD